MNWIKGIIAKLIGKEIGDQTSLSKTKLTAVIFVLITGIVEISKAWGHPIAIPDFVYKLLEGAGLWSLRSAIKS